MTYFQTANQHNYFHTAIQRFTLCNMSTPIIIAIGNQKGGCGKTTITMNLAGGLTKAGYNVLVVDADPQSSATVWSIAKGQESLPFDVANMRSPGMKGQFAGLLKLDYDLILIDCPPGVADTQDASGRFGRDALRGADAILVPIRPSALDFAAASTFVRLLEREKSPDTKTAVVINGRQNTRIGREAPGFAARIFAPIANAIILETTIGQRAPITEVSGSGMTIFDFDSNCKAAHEFTALTKEILSWLQSTAPLSTPSA